MNERNVWSRESITSCSCDENRYRHVHCPCHICRGKAVSRVMELLHWKTYEGLSTPHDPTYCIVANSNDESILYDDLNTSTTAISTDENILYDDLNTSTTGTSEVMQRMDIDNVEADNNLPSVNSEIDPLIFLDTSLGEENREPNDDHDRTSLKSIIVEAIMDAIRITEKHSFSKHAFADILSLGKKILCNKLSDEIDADTADMFWPQSWEQAQTILKECGYSEAKQYYVCFCLEEKQVK